MTNANSPNAVRETAADLLKEIAKERESLIKAGKIKKSKPLPEITEDEIPYEIPENWEWVRLGDIICLTSGQHIEPTDCNLDGKGMPYLTGPSDFGEKYAIISKWTEFPKVTVEKQSILITVKGSGVGKTNILPENASIGRQLMAISSILFSDDYLLYFLKYYQISVSNLKKGAAIPGISREDILELTFPLPPLSEQKEIVALLDDVFSRIDKARENIGKSIENADELYQSKVDSIFYVFADKSASKKLKDICIIRPPKRDIIGKLSPDTVVSFAPMEDLGINQKYLQPTKEKHLSEVSGSYTYFSDNDVLLAKVTPCFENGKVGIARDLMNSVGFGSSEYIVYRPKEGLLSEYLYYFLNRASVRKIGEGSMDGSVGLKRIQKIFYEDIEIPLPPLSKQQEIVAELDALEKQRSTLIELYTTKLRALDELKQSLLEKAFRGELT